MKLTPEFLRHLEQCLRDPEWPNMDYNRDYIILARQTAAMMLMTGIPHWIQWSRGIILPSAGPYVNTIFTPAAGQDWPIVVRDP